jgi:hypothetical protein
MLWPLQKWFVEPLTNLKLGLLQPQLNCHYYAIDISGS